MWMRYPASESSDASLCICVSDDVSVLLRQIMSEARQLTSAERCSLFLVDRKEKELIAKVFDGQVLPDGTVQVLGEDASY